MSIIEQLAIIHAEERQELLSCLLVEIVLIVLLLFTYIYFWRKTRDVPPCKRIAILSIISLATVYAGTKAHSPRGTVTFLRTDSDVAYFIDKGSYTTNDYVYVDFTTHPILPLTANFYGEYRALSDTNDTDWVEFVNTTIEDFAPPQSIALDSATNYNFRFYTDWTPSPIVHTNGVLNVNWGKANSDNLEDLYIGIPVRTEIFLDATNIAPRPLTVFSIDGTPIETNHDSGLAEKSAPSNIE